MNLATSVILVILVIAVFGFISIKVLKYFPIGFIIGGIFMLFNPLSRIQGIIVIIIGLLLNGLNRWIVSRLLHPKKRINSKGDEIK